MKKYCFDTNVLLNNPHLLRDYCKNTIISKTIFNELDYRKRFAEHQENAQISIKYIEQYRLEIIGNSVNGINNDEKIITDLAGVSIIIVTNDVGMRERCRSHNIEAVSFEQFRERIDNISSKSNPIGKKIFALLSNNLDIRNYHEDGNSLNYYLDDGTTPLIHFIKRNNIKAIEKILLLGGIDIDKADNSKLKMTPLLHATQKKSLPIIKMLLKKGANPHLYVRGKNKGNSALLIAIWDGNLSIVQFYIESINLGISVNQTDGNGFTPLIKAIIRKHIDIIEYLLQRKDIDFNIRDHDGYSALCHARKSNNQQVINLLKGRI